MSARPFRPPPLIGHRGAAATAPENTLAGIRRAHAEGASWVEVDVRLTADAIPVLLHDATLDRTTTGTGKLRDHGIGSLAGLGAARSWQGDYENETIPALADCLELCAALGLGLDIELKEDDAAEAVINLVEGRTQPLAISCFDPAPLARVRRLAPALPVLLLCADADPRWRAVAEALDADALGFPDRVVDAALVAAAGSFPVTVFTVNDPDRARELFALGVQSLFTDTPGRLAPIAAFASPGLGP